MEPPGGAPGGAGRIFPGGAPGGQRFCALAFDVQNPNPAPPTGPFGPFNRNQRFFSGRPKFQKTGRGAIFFRAKRTKKNPQRSQPPGGIGDRIRGDVPPRLIFSAVTALGASTGIVIFRAPPGGGRPAGQKKFSGGGGAGGAPKGAGPAGQPWASREKKPKRWARLGLFEGVLKKPAAGKTKNLGISGFWGGKGTHFGWRGRFFYWGQKTVSVGSKTGGGDRAGPPPQSK